MTLKTTQLYIILFLLLSQSISAQNLLSNGDFEDYNHLPFETAQWSLCNGWSNVNGLQDFPDGSPDYFHTLGTSRAQLPNTAFVTADPFSGDGIMAFQATSKISNFREYITTQFIRPMRPGERYKISYALTNGRSGWESANGCNHIGMLFTTTLPIQNTHEVINQTPQIDLTEEFWDSTWVTFTFEYIADVSYQHLTIGNFYSDVETSQTQYVDAPSPNSYYLIDNIQIIPTLSILGEPSICQGDTATLTAINDTSFAWADSLNPSMIISTDSIIRVSPDSTTTYLVYGSEDTTSFQLIVHELPKVDLGNDTTLTLCVGESYELSVPRNPEYFYRWQDNSTDTSITITASGTYWLRLTNRETRCSSTDTIQIQVEQCPVTPEEPAPTASIELPTAFTPNGDHINDVFEPINYEGIVTMNFRVYNRWGNQVFETQNPQISWTPVNLPADVYYWSAKYTGEDGREYISKGWVQLMR